MWSCHVMSSCHVMWSSDHVIMSSDHVRVRVRVRAKVTVRVRVRVRVTVRVRVRVHVIMSCDHVVMSFRHVIAWSCVMCRVSCDHVIMSCDQVIMSLCDRFTSGEIRNNLARKPEVVARFNWFQLSTCALIFLSHNMVHSESKMATRAVFPKFGKIEPENRKWIPCRQIQLIST